jgi:hypothetical protein
MPTSKHRRKGKLRPRGKVNNAIPPRPVIDPDDHWRDPVLIAQLQKMFGGNDWTDAQIDAALDEIDRETDAMEQRVMARVRPAPEPQQLELFPVNSLAETSR